MASEGEPGVVVRARLVRLPEVQQALPIGWHARPNTYPVTLSSVPEPDSTVRSGEFGLKYVPSIWSGVGWPSQAGVSSGWPPAEVQASAGSANTAGRALLRVARPSGWCGDCPRTYEARRTRAID
jgi:hypothetical protein